MKNPRAIISPLAAQDLQEIGDYIAQDSPFRALNTVCDLKKCCTKLAANPHIGVARHNLGEQLRLFPHKRYNIFYRPMEQGIEIVRVLHGARDVEGQFHDT